MTSRLVWLILLVVVCPCLGCTPRYGADFDAFYADSKKGTQGSTTRPFSLSTVPSNTTAPWGSMTMPSDPAARPDLSTLTVPR